MSADLYLSILKNKGYKLTPKRKAVIELFLQENGILAPRDVYRQLEKQIHPLGFPTVYRILEEFSLAGILIPVLSDERLLSYALCRRPQEHHHHFICHSCQRVEDVDYCGIAGAQETIEKKLGCRIDTHLFQLEGICSDCLKNKR